MWKHSQKSISDVTIKGKQWVEVTDGGEGIFTHKTNLTSVSRIYKEPPLEWKKKGGKRESRREGGREGEKERRKKKNNERIDNPIEKNVQTIWKGILPVILWKRSHLISNQRNAK